MILEVVVFVLVVALVAVVGLRIGMLVAPRVGRLADRKGDDDDDAG